MTRADRLPLPLLLLLILVAFAGRTTAWAEDAAAVKAKFANPPREYATAPLWVWNDMLTEEQVRGTLRDLAGQKVRQAFVHPRPGLMTPYLSPDWFRLWKVALDEAERLDMNVWIYDENSYPSGFAGGLVPEAMPESRGKGVHFAEVTTVEKPGSDVLAVYRVSNEGFENVTEAARTGEALPEGRYLVAHVRLAPTGGWFGGTFYVDLLKPGVTEKFIEITMEAYRRELGEHFGKRLPGWFTDEPHLAPAGGLHWSDTLAEDFRKRWGYDLVDHLPSLVRPLGDWKRVRHNYYQLLLEQFIDRWARPCYEYCEKHDLEFTGHYWEHGWPGAGHGGDNMAMYAWHQRPAIDTLMNEYDEGVNAQFGNVRSVKELGSVANQLGRKRTLCEAYGAGGWDLRFEDMKRIGDWLYVLGVNTLDEHLSYITIRGARKRDHPQSFSYHEPWWDSYHVMAEYFTRLSLVMSSGEEINQVLVIEPTTTSWMYQGEGHLGEIGNSFQKLVTDLSKAQVEYDIGCEDIIAREGNVRDLVEVHGAPGPTDFLVGNRVYHTVVLPPHTENLNTAVMQLVQEFSARGGCVLCCGPPPSLVDGRPSQLGEKAAQSTGWKRVEPDALTARLLERSGGTFAIRRSSGDQGILFHQRRWLKDGQILLLVNTSIDSPASGVIESSSLGFQRWDVQSGAIGPYPFTSGDIGIRATFHLPPCGSLLLFLSDKPLKPAPPDAGRTATIQPAGPPKIRRLEPNVLPLDYVDISVGGETRENTYFYPANRLVWQKHGLDGNPWDSAVQLHDRLIAKTFPADSGFEATYRFTIEDRVPGPLQIVIERPDLYTIACNGKPVVAQEGDWWLDKAFGKIDITSAAQPGQNAVTIKASPMTMYHELEPAYLLGDFSLKPADSGFVLSRPQPLTIGRREGHVTTPDGTMWLSAGIQYQSSSKDDGDPLLIFDLGDEYDLDAIKIWNYNEVNLTARGVKRLKITGSATGKEGSFTTVIGMFDLDQAQSGSIGPSSNPYFPRTLRVRAADVRFVMFDILSNHRGTEFPTTDGSVDNAFVGLSEVQFFGGRDGDEAAMISGVRVAEASSELGGNFNRQARMLVNGSGLIGPGWNRQGLPFYAAGVAYTQTFEVAEPQGRYRVALPSWRGSVARVRVNGRSAGHIAWQPWQCDVTKQIRPGANTIEVTVVGTLRNTLGPHHAGAVAGRAWPHIFRQAPETGPPPGEKYDTLDYGLFEPFVLKQVRGR
ncbi:MAG: hypothetical protein JXB62_04935 [Pirellulales bacterium]|nr:hypothetical protein [Pirellulales bacterium]